ncbi:GntR family transcriptional regulator [Amycolatopsis sp. WAC 01376]|uniref:GntR family transcriptional regulator n=1 Tax=Amycolatopsis sp. WAC 01376 TaxID=2203195 RepID=UPI000F78C140|nr:GntR family transcriptional regulator [Amycolatopsis sp. WAC 01376]RSM58964.1 GntR family transcriptional regulator [Amycolatopsis sp. WAC 01376]
MVPFEQIADDLRTRIRTGQLAPGDKLPSARELATTQGVAPNTASRALRLLVDEGWATSRGPVGTFVSDSIPAGDEPLTLAAVAQQVAELSRTVADLQRKIEGT